MRDSGYVHERLCSSTNEPKDLTMDTSSSDHTNAMPSCLNIILGGKIPRRLLSSEDWLHLCRSAWEDLREETYYLHEFTDMTVFQRHALSRSADRIGGETDTKSAKLDLCSPEKERYLHICRLPISELDRDNEMSTAKEWWICASELVLTQGGKLITYLARYKGIDNGAEHFMPFYTTTSIVTKEVWFSELPLTALMETPHPRRPNRETVSTPLGGLVLDGLIRPFRKTAFELDSRKARFEHVLSKVERWQDRLQPASNL